MTASKSKPDLISLLEQAAWPAFLVDGGGTIRRANEAAVTLFGPALESDTASLNTILGEPGTEPFLTAWERSTPGFQTLKFRCKGGTVASFTTCICVRHWEEEKRFLFQLFRELPATAAVKGPTLEASVAHKQKLDCALQLARTVALDFNNALTSILGYTSLMLAQIEPGNTWRNTLVQVEKAAEKAAEIAQQLATFTRPEKENGTLAPANLNSVLRRVVDTFRQAPSPKIDWTLELEEQLYAARFDEAKVQQAFIKIIENACEACGQFGRISVQSRNLDLTEPFRDRTVHLDPGCYVTVDIIDDGAGIDPEVMPRIFEPFYTTKPGHRGLGLAWVYGIITNHGGGVTISSQLRHGAAVRVYLPADRRIVKERVGQETDLGGHQTILMVDDEEALLALGQTILSTFGYQVLTANNGPKALEVLSTRGESIDLVITDLVMPQMSGRELMEKIQAMAPGLPILCTSGYVRPTRPDDHERFLAKPFTSQELLWRVKQLLGERAKPTSAPAQAAVAAEQGLK